MSSPASPSRPRRLDPSLIAWLTVIWMLLWSGPTWGNLVSGILVAVALCLVFPLPAVELALRLWPLGILRLAGYLIYDMVVSSATVTRQALGGRKRPAAVIAVQLRCRTDLMIAATAVAVSCVPGGALVEVNAATATLYLHMSDADDHDAVRRTRRDVWRLEALVVRAFGTRAEIKRVAAEPEPPPAPPGSPGPPAAPEPPADPAAPARKDSGP
ncbi:Na+/H+ antiporter subunit E [Streptomyces sp. NPDC046853]|uniref:Na+/H+ antiporter subunit E n=1 Tax=Streptomyces sp. NPDC046853 TaxID=3154920 RepID=UPI0033C83F31